MANRDGLYFDESHNPLALAGCNCAACVMQRKERRDSPQFHRDIDEYDGESEIELGVGEWKE